jgi:hypothetical protein
MEEWASLLPKHAEAAVDKAVERVVEPSLTELLEEPIVRQLMTSDGVSESEVRAVARIAQHRIEQSRQSGLTGDPPSV